MSMQTIETGRDLEEARLQPRAFVFLWVNWAIQVRVSQRTVQFLVESWQAANSDLPAPCYLADLSSQEGEVWEAVRKWLQAEGKPVDTLTFGGNGALLWVRSGSVVEYAGFAGGVEKRELLAVSQRVFGATA